MDIQLLKEIICKKVNEINLIIEKFDKPEPIYKIDIDLALSKVRSLYNELLMLEKNTSEPYNLPINKDPYNELTEVAEKTVIEESVEKETEEKELFVEEKDDSSFELVIEEPEEKNSEEEEQFIENIPEIISEKEEKVVIVTNETVADNLSETKQNINDILSKLKSETDLASKLKQKPITDIRSAISLNDKMMFIRDLFDNNADVFNQVIEKINSSGSLDAALEQLASIKISDEESEGLTKLIELIYRRFATV